MNNHPQTLRDNLKLSTWLLLGALLQGIASLVLPKSYALLPVVLILLQRALDMILACYGVTHNSHMDDVLPGRFTAQIPGHHGAPPPTKPAEHDVAVVLLGLRSNQYVMNQTVMRRGGQYGLCETDTNPSPGGVQSPLGMFGPGVKEISMFSKQMVEGLYQNAEEQGCKLPN